MRALSFIILAWVILPVWAWQGSAAYPFGVLNQRSLTLTAEYWNPILDWVSRRAGVPLTLKIARTANETTDMAVRGELAFVFTNHLFTPERDKLGYTVIARQEGEGIRGQIVVREDSPVRRIEDLAGQTVVFPNPYAFAGYFLPYDALLRAGVEVRPVFAGNQEAAMAQLKHGRAAAAGVNHQVMADYARREGFGYRVLWQSEPYHDLAVMVHPAVPARVREAVREALLALKTDSEGRRVLAEAAARLGLATARGFVAADDRDYDPYRRFFRTTRVPLPGP
ncbi:MAG: phosphate/phosphite/phosphonate ABC transporter substrate-binding protein [Thiobacillaceae bacterium]|nr:phosphate/phosphite/phosphonate ABC transporter substrate-binding protein [Thiobacillaceae bacterium]MCX7663283.1 phosphate/phosphite/phosphonate ABC transporter substrate-binding protein [Tepidimonas fonticaldi]MDW8324857.1 phosphate/phosphite/phosphonate ABC transporter substrate-binding protein [Burkholderiales bacterium]